MAHAAWTWMVVAAAVGAGVMACSDDDDGGGGPKNPPGSGVDAGVNENRPGLGEDPGEPRGTPLNLPAGVSISGHILGANELTGECEGGSEPQGSGPAVKICVPMRNTTGAAVQLELPRGLTVISTSAGRYQNGLLVERVVVTLPPTAQGPGVPTDGGTDPDAFLVALHLYCLNEARNPSETGNPYKLGPVTDDAALRELLQLLVGKQLDNDDAVDVVQDAIYSITEGNGLTSEDREALEDL
ncbi:hypothetical protein [Pyxidicoccus xibeiensis]|uniref:hypothetical protein n=1 Tax=Pyxidicoccus xibeiensis TaxID=2906759 RepID=UPI0020A72B50|nr:hypothetical protein [Pyxidicoccus xibeiensis]MCP3145302.1 hypothetical protein [Pyxidicoccus xibeiensis]